MRQISRASFRIHLWLGVLSTVSLIVIAITGVMLNHKRGLGFMPEVDHEPSSAFSNSVPLHDLAAIALNEAALRSGADRETIAGGNGDVDVGLIDRMDVRPRDGLVKVRLRDRAHTEVTVDIASGAVLHTGRRSDVFLEQLHSGEVFGGPFVILSDIAAIALLLTLITGYWLWLIPKLSKTHTRPALPQGGE